jgi:adenosylcobinamide-GDP ribazoletransferase
MNVSDRPHGPSFSGGAQMLGDALFDFKLALSFLTRLPVPLGRRVEPRALAGCAPWFPLVGALIGLAGAAVYMLALRLGLTSFIAATLCLGALALVTGALHEDGLADVADGFGGGRTREQKLRIMRDPRLGTYGAIALALALLARLGALSTIATPAAVGAALVASGAASRALLPLALTLWPPAREDGLGAAAGRPAALQAAGTGGLALLLLLLLLDPMQAAIGAIAALAAGGAVGALARRQIGGLTGDVLGAIQQAGEIALLLVVAASAPFA